MTLRVVNATPLPFEQIVVEEMAQPLAAHGFQHAQTFNLYVGQQVEFKRRREQQEEEIVLQRAFYGSEQLTALNLTDEVEAVPINYSDEQHWVSRHSLSVQFVVNGATNSLQRDGRAGTGDDDWWDFTDEEDLRRLLRELLPLILAAGLPRFDDRLEDYETGRLKHPAA